MKNFEELQASVIDWADKHELLKIENSERQFMKFIEEVFEFKTEYDFIKSRREKDLVYFNRDMMLEMGDIFVTLIILCEQLNLSPQYCLKEAYQKIKDRKGKTINGTFIKEEDL